MAKPAKHPSTRTGPRNTKLYDPWSFAHLITGVVLGWVMAPLLAIGLMVAYEPFEIFVLSPLFDRFGIKFGYEAWQNSFSDIVFDIIGVSLGAWALTAAAVAPVHWF